jgi:hypothetical protein
MTSRLVALLLLGLSLYAADGYASESTAPRGEGVALISGARVTDIRYVLDTTDPSFVDCVSFSMDAARTPGRVSVRLTGAASSWYACEEQPEGGWSCATPGLLVAQADMLQVVSAN